MTPAEQIAYYDAEITAVLRESARQCRIAQELLDKRKEVVRKMRDAL